MDNVFTAKNNMNVLGSKLNGNKLIGTDEACRVLGVSRPTLLRLANNKRIRHIKIGSRYKFSMDGLQEYIDRQTVNIED